MSRHEVHTISMKYLLESGPRTLQNASW